MLDPLSDVLTHLEMRGSLYFRTDLRGEWAVSVPRHPGVARFHVLVSGPCRVQVGPDAAPLQRGDLVVVPHGAAHMLSDAPGRSPVPLDQVLDATAYDGGKDLRVGEGAEPTVLVCGHFAFADELLHPVLDSLPALIHLRAAEGSDFTWLDAATRAVGKETAERPPGWEAVVDHVTSVLFIQALRGALGRTTRTPAMAAFGDPQLGRALGAIHEQHARPWSLDELARHAGMSRTTFATRFRARMGVSPIAYATRWRMQRARRDLLGSDDIVVAVAERAGYRSEAAFCRAFARFYGTPPATYRKEHRDVPR